MDPLRDKQEEMITNFRELKKLNGEEFRAKLISLTLESKRFSEDLHKVKYGDGPLDEHELFRTKRDPALALFRELFEKNHGHVKLKSQDALVIPSKLILVLDRFDSLAAKEDLTTQEIDELINLYRKIFETVLKILCPHFKAISGKNDHLDWSDINKSIKELSGDYFSLFSSMNGQLRNAIAHESSYLERNRFIWVLDDGTQKEYPLDKVRTKIVDLIFLVFVLYWGMEEVYVDEMVKVYRSTPIRNLKAAFETVKL